MSSVIGYIALTVGIALTLFNIYATATLKKRNQINKAKYDMMFAPVEKVLLEKQKECGCRFLSVTRVVTDTEEPVVIVSDEKKKIAAVATSTDVEVFPFDLIESVSIKNDEKTNNISVLLSLKDKNITYPIATKGYRKGNLNRKLCADMARRFCDALDFSQPAPEGNKKEKKS